jgi:cell division protein FtsN
MYGLPFKMTQLWAIPRSLMGGIGLTASIAIAAPASAISHPISVAQVTEGLPPPPSGGTVVVPSNPVPLPPPPDTGTESSPDIEPEPALPPPPEPEVEPEPSRSPSRSRRRSASRSSRQYIVIVEGDSPLLLQQVQRIQSDAFIVDDDGDRVIQAGSFTDRDQAEEHVDVLEDVGIEADVVRVRNRRR